MTRKEKENLKKALEEDQRQIDRALARATKRLEEDPDNTPVADEEEL